MRMMPHAAPCACVSMPLRMQVRCAEQVSENGRCWFNSGSQKNNTWFVKTLQYMLSTFELFVVLFIALSTVDYLFAFSFSEPPAAGCVQHSFLHFTPPNIAKAQPRFPPCPPSPRNSVIRRLCVMHISVMPDS